MRPLSSFARSQSTGPLVAIVLAVIVLVLHARVVLGGRTWDDVRYHADVAPPRLAAAELVASGQLPTWWDGTGLGVPLLAEPSHGAAYPPVWLAQDPLALDLVWLAHLFWLALGIAVWARRLGASELTCVIGGVWIAASGIATSMALRGALPALAHLPWVAWAAHGLASDASADEASAVPRRVRATVVLGLTLGAIGLAGQLALLVDAVALAVVVAARRGSRRMLSAGLAGGLAIGALQWMPAALTLGDTAGGTLEGLKLSRLLELLVPGSFGSSSPAQAIPQLAGSAPYLPSMFVGAPVLAFAAVARPPMRVAALALALGGLALVWGRGGWPAWLGAPEVHVAALVVIAAAHAARGLDALIAGERRGRVALAGAAGATLLALAGLVVLRRQLGAVPALDRALVDGGLGVACLLGALALAWRLGSTAEVGVEGPVRAPRLAIVAALLVVAPNVGALGATAPLIAREVVMTPPAWVDAALAGARPASPLRVFRPVQLYEDVATSSVGDALATLAGTSAARHGIAAARSDDPARPAIHDRVWFAAAAAGGALLERYSIELAILPGSMVEGRNLVEIARRGNAALVRYPASPPAALVSEWLWIDDDATTIARLFPPGAGRGLPAGLVVLRGRGRDMQDEPGSPEPCLVARWHGGSIDVTCTTEEPAYAVISSTSARGWTVHVDGVESPWVTADLMRRAVPVEAGAHMVSWRYEAPGLVAGLVVAGAGLAGLAVFTLVITLRRRRSTRDRASLETS